MLRRQRGEAAGSTAAQWRSKVEGSIVVCLIIDAIGRVYE